MLAPLGSEVTQPRYLQETTRRGDCFVFPLSSKLTAPRPSPTGAADNLQACAHRTKSPLVSRWKTHDLDGAIQESRGLGFRITARQRQVPGPEQRACVL